MIEIAGVSREFAKEGRSVVALQGIDLAVREGEFVALLGPSGCGKSTLLNMVAGFDFPTAGSVRVAGETVRAPSPQRGVVFQEPALFPWFSVMDNVVFGPKTRGEKAADYRPRAMQILEQVGLRGFEDAYPAELSGGMRQRVGIARVLMLESRVMLMDEPFGALDAQTRSLMQELLLQVWERHQQTVLFVTHDIEEALRLASVIAVMERGRLAQWGTPVELLEHPASDFVAEFVGGDGAELKLLGLRRVADRLRPGETADGEPIAADASLRDALATMAARRVDRLPVIDAEGRSVGAITLADLVR